MQVRMSWLVVVLVASSATAQSLNYNAAVRFDQTTEWTSRGANGSSRGFVSAAFPHGLNAGLNTLTKVVYTVQDQEAMTPEPFHVGVCSLNAAGDPDYSAPRYYATGLQMPTSPPGIQAYDVTHTWTLPTFKINPATSDQWHHVWAFSVSANWGTDGLSVHMSDGAPWNNTLLCLNNGHREIPRIDGNPPMQILEEMAWSAQPTSSRPTSLDATWKLVPSWDEIALTGGSDNTVYNTGCPNPNLGLAAIDPDFFDSGSSTPPRHDNYTWSVNAGARYGGGVGVLLFSLTALPGAGVVTPYGTLYVDPFDPLFAIGPVVMPALDGVGSSSFRLDLGAPSSPFRQVIRDFPSWSTQAAVLTATQPLKLSTLSTMRPRLLPPGFTAGTTVQGTPLSVSRTPGPNPFSVRNDGRGEIEVQFFIGTTKVGPAYKVAERVMARLTGPVASNRIEITGAKTTATRVVYQ